MKIKYIVRKKSKGSVVDVLTVGICVLAMSIIMTAYLNSLGLVNTKMEVSQLSRKYILRMESVGYLTAADRIGLTSELMELGVSDVDLGGTTFYEVDYGSPVILNIEGVIHGRETNLDKGLFGTIFREKEFVFRDVRMSTAKN